jgi:hypothetical protein
MPLPQRPSTPTRLSRALAWIAAATALVCALLDSLAAGSNDDNASPRTHALANPDSDARASDAIWRLEAAWFAIARESLDEALLCAGSAEFAAGRTNTLKLAFGGEPREPRLQFRPELHVRRLEASEGAPAFAFGFSHSSGELEAEFEWRGEALGLQLLKLRSPRSYVNTRWIGSGRSTSTTLLSSSLLLAQEQVCAEADLGSGLVLLLYLTPASAPRPALNDPQLWRARCRALAASSSASDASLARSALEQLDPRGSAGPAAWPDAHASAAIASLLLRDATLAAFVRASGVRDFASLSVGGLDTRGPSQRALAASTCAALASGEAPPVIPSAEFALALSLRGLVVQDESSAAEHLARALLPRVERAESGFGMARYLEYTPDEPVREAWNELRTASLRALPPPWNFALRSSVTLIAFALAPWLAGMLFALLLRPRAARPTGVSRFVLAALLITGLVQATGAALLVAFALVFWAQCVEHLRFDENVTGSERAVVGLACGATLFAALVDIGWMVSAPWSTSLAKSAPLLAWAVLARWLWRDTSWRAPQRFDLALTLVLASFIVVSVAPAALAASIGKLCVLAALVALAFFALAGRAPLSATRS